MAIQGYGKVGARAARYVKDEGCQVLAIGDVDGGIYRASGLDGAIERWVEFGQRIAAFPDAEPITNDELLTLPVDVLVPVAIDAVITGDKEPDVQTRMNRRGGQRPTSPEADRILSDKGVVVVPGILANAGGVVVSYFEWVQNLQAFSWSERETT